MAVITRIRLSATGWILHLSGTSKSQIIGGFFSFLTSGTKKQISITC